MDCSLQMQLPSPSQIPLVWPSVTQLAVQAKFPREQRNPALTRLVVTSSNNRLVLMVLENIVRSGY